MANKTTAPKRRRSVKDESQRPYVMIDAELISVLTPMEFITYAQIKRRAGGHGECWESIEHMAEETSMSTGSLKRSLKVLLAKNLICKEKRTGTTDIYTLTPPSKWKLDTHVEREATEHGSVRSTEHGSVRSTEHGSVRSTEHGSVRSTNKIPFINKIPSSNISSNSLLDSHAKTLDTIEDGSLAARRTENIQSGDPENERLSLARIQTAISLATVPDLLEKQAIAPACSINADDSSTEPIN